MKFIYFLMFILFISSVSAYTIVCEDEVKGFQLWDHNQTYNETGWTIEEMQEEEGMNCSLIEIPVIEKDCPQYEPIINQLNQRLKENYAEIQTLENKIGRYGFYKFFSILFLIVIIVLITLMRIK